MAVPAVPEEEGEEHDDAIAHKLQEIIFAHLASRRPAALSLEMSMVPII